MSKMSELDAVLTELSAHAKATLAAAQSIRELLSAPEADATGDAPPLAKTFTLEEVRAALLAKRKAGFKDEIKALLVAHGAERLTDIDPAEYAAMVQEAEAIGT